MSRSLEGTDRSCQEKEIEYIFMGRLGTEMGESSGKGEEVEIQRGTTKKKWGT